MRAIADSESVTTCCCAEVTTPRCGLTDVHPHRELCDGLMSPYSRYRPLPGSDGVTVLQAPPGCRPAGPTACRFLRWIAKLSPQAVNKQGLGRIENDSKIDGFYLNFDKNGRNLLEVLGIFMLVEVVYKSNVSLLLKMIS